MALAEITVVGIDKCVSEKSLVVAVHNALVAGLGVPADDPTVLVSNASPHAALPGSLERMVLIRVTMFAGRSAETRERLHGLIAREVSQLGVAAGEIRTVFVETPVSNWGVDGIPQSVDSVGFNIHI